jgi:glycosyltransferase involved in cell wall biosynthesis
MLHQLNSMESVQHTNAERRDGRIAVITISKDDPQGLRRTLASITSQTGMAHELVLVRAGRSCEVPADSACAGRVIDIADPGRGISAAFNAAIAACTSEWLMFLNGGDALAQRGGLGRLGAQCAVAAEADIVTFRARTDAGTSLPRHPPSSFCSFLYISHQASLFRRSLFSSVGPYSESFRIRMDLDWMARYLLQLGPARIRFVDEAVVEYRLDGISSTSLWGFHLEEIRVLLRSIKFMPALADLSLRRMPGRMVQAGLRRAARH